MIFLFLINNKFEMSKMLNAKQQKKYRNETMNILSHLNSRTTVNKLDKSIKSFKTQKQEVQSSRVENTSMFYKKDNKSIQSQSRNGDKSFKSTKKNSLPKYQKNLQNSFEIRLKTIQNIFNDQSRQSYRLQTLQQKICDYSQQFKRFKSYIDDRKQEMIFDDFDYLINNILKCFEQKLSKLCQISLDEHMTKVSELNQLIELTIAESTKQLIEQQQKLKKLNDSYLEIIQNMTVKSLYTTEKINMINYMGLFDFEKYCRKIDKSYDEEHLGYSNLVHDKDIFASEYCNEERMKVYEDHQDVFGTNDDFEGEPYQYNCMIEQITGGQYQADKKIDPYNNNKHQASNLQNKNGKIRKQLINQNQKNQQNIKNPDIYKQFKMGDKQLKIMFKENY